MCQCLQKGLQYFTILYTYVSVCVCIYIYIYRKQDYFMFQCLQKGLQAIFRKMCCVAAHCALRTQVANIQNEDDQSSYFGQDRPIYRKCSVKYVTAQKHALDTEGKLTTCVRKKETCRERKKQFIPSYVQQGYTTRMNIQWCNVTNSLQTENERNLIRYQALSQN